MYNEQQNRKVLFIQAINRDCRFANQALVNHWLRSERFFDITINPVVQKQKKKKTKTKLVNHAIFPRQFQLARLIELPQLFNRHDRRSIMKPLDGLLLLKRSIMTENDIMIPRKFNSFDFTPLENNYHSCFNFRTGSIERLIDGDKRVIATKHLLPENNINVVVR